MMQHWTEQFAGYECLALSNGIITLHVMKNAGPRIIGLQVGDGLNLMAEVPLAGEGPDEFIPRGGQRLWHGPEDPVRSYLPDNEPVSFGFNARSVVITQKTEKESGIQKSIEIALADERAEATLQHGLLNHNLWPVSMAAWAIAQMRTGGFAILPQSVQDTGLLPNRRVVFWPYADVKSDNLVMGNRYIFLRANYPAGEKTKIGWLNPRGWLGYYLDRTLFIKKADFIPHGDYIDLGCSMESYCDDRFLEVETISPLTTVAPHTKLVYQEKWFVFPNVVMSMTEESVEEVIKDLKIE